LDICVRNSCNDFNSYRAARVKSLFNAESGAEFNLDASLDIDDGDWRLGVIVGPSGSGKSSMGRKIFGEESFYEPSNWPTDKPIVDAISPEGDFDAVTGALATVGLGSVPCWLRPYHALSNGERFRADLAKIVSEAPAKIVVDEFTSVVDRQIAKFGALAFQKAWRRTNGQAVLLSCHYDVLDWLEPDWVFDTGKQTFLRGSLRRRPKFKLEIQQTDSGYWSLFKNHYYLNLPLPVAAQYFVGAVDGEPVCHLAMTTKSLRKGAFEGRATRLVVMPEWQGAGVGMRFLNAICEMWLRGENKWGRHLTSQFHTSHPGLCAGLRRDPKWHQVSANLYGANKVRSTASTNASARKQGKEEVGKGTGFGGHFRAIQGFRYYGEIEQT
jgi:energy-coupling factor transporter ATP-binding protein EcfA2